MQKRLLFKIGYAYKIPWCVCGGGGMTIWPAVYNEAKRIFLQRVQNIGNNKTFKMVPELVPSGRLTMA